MNKRGFEVKQDSDGYRRHQPEAVLALAVIHRAIYDVLYEDTKVKPNRNTKQEAMRWLGLTQEISPLQENKEGSFAWWCNLLGLSRSYVTEAVRKIMDKKTDKRTRRRVIGIV